MDGQTATFLGRTNRGHGQKSNSKDGNMEVNVLGRDKSRAQTNSGHRQIENTDKFRTQKNSGHGRKRDIRDGQSERLNPYIHIYLLTHSNTKQTGKCTTLVKKKLRSISY